MLTDVESATAQPETIKSESTTDSVSEQSVVDSIEPTEREAKAQITLSEDAFASRLERAKRQAEREARNAILRELGIDDPKTLETEREELRRLREEREAAAREKLTKEQRLEADLQVERKKREALEAELRQVKTSSVYDKQDAMIQGIGLQHIDPKFWKYARNDFIEYISSLSPAQTAKMTEKDIDRWFAKLARTTPTFALHKPEADKSNEVEEPKVRRRPITTTKPAANVSTPKPKPTQTDPSMSPEGKTFRPGLPNSMTASEARAELKRRGMRGW